TDLIVTFKGRDVNLSKTAASVGSSFGKMGGAITAGVKVGATAFATLGIATVAAGAKLIGLGSDAEEMMGKFNVVFANTGGEVIASLDDFAGAVGRSKFELRAMASTFGDTLKPLGFTEEAAAGMSVTLTELATDLGSFNDMPMDEALQRLQGTLIGNHENALAFGVIINENTLKAELAAQGWDNLTGSALEQAKVQARINLLMQGTTDAQGDAARTSASWANQMRALKATITDAATEMGLNLLPLFTPLLEKVGELAQDAIPFLTEAFQKIIVFLEPVVEGLLLFFDNIAAGMEPLAAFRELLSTVIPQPLLDSLITLLPLIAGVAAAFATFTILTTIVGWIGGLITAITAVGGFLSAMAGGFALAGGGISGVTAVLSGIVALLGGPVTIAIAAITALVAVFAAAWANNWFDIQGKTATAIAAIQVWFNNLKVTWEQLKVIIIVGAQEINVWWNNLKVTWEQLKTIISIGITIIKTKFAEFKSSIQTAVTSAIEK
ncbi:MAG: hypothetical protein GY943_10820, partial [Chloroflexi bacterium]|nr:hypothetical protein [Chloroflexota bacterium]